MHPSSAVATPYLRYRKGLLLKLHVNCLTGVGRVLLYVRRLL